jgi:hypothetical protein
VTWGLVNLFCHQDDLMVLLGNSVKALHPRNIGFAEVREIHLMEDSTWLLWDVS